MMSIRRYETGARQPNEVDLQNIADALDTSIEYLLGQTNYAGKPIIIDDTLDEGPITREDRERMLESLSQEFDRVGEILRKGALTNFDLLQEDIPSIVERLKIAAVSMEETIAKQKPWAEFYKKYGFKSGADLDALFDDFDAFLKRHNLTPQRFYEMLDDLSKLTSKD